MREIVAVNANLMLTGDGDNDWTPAVEIIIITSEPQYHLDEDFELKVRRRDCEQFRLLATEKSITAMIEGLEKARFNLQSQATAANNANQERKKAA